MEHQKKKKERKSVSVSRKKKAMKEVDDNMKRGVEEAMTAVVVAEDNNNKRRHNNAKVDNIQENSLLMGVEHEHEHDHEHEHEHDHDHDGFEDCRIWWRPGMLVDEQMSWGSIWFSYLDEDANCHAFYSDVVEDDLWDLKSIQHTPHHSR